MNRLHYTILGDPASLAVVRTTILPFVDSTALVAGSVDATKKARLEVDGITAGATRVITVPDRDLTIGPTLGTPVASTSGTSIDFTGIPSGTKIVKIMFVGVSTNGNSDIIVQIGDSGGIEPSGYLGSSATTANGAATAAANYTSGFGVIASNAVAVIHGAITISIMNSATFTVVASGVFGRSDNTGTIHTGGSKSTSAELDRIRITTVGGTDTFDAGSINISYE